MRAAEGLPLAARQLRTLNELFQETVAAHAHLPALGVAAAPARNPYAELADRERASAARLESWG
ncbi:MAG: hypothetical protein FIB01_04905, partial [Gemmatimonadetes bacterium]|nr:hypothetical protein [Gemmatimonadota bacterium]